MEIATNTNQITILYVENSPRAKQTIAYCKSAGLAIREINIMKTRLTGTMIIEIADSLSIPLIELVNRNHPLFRRYYAGAQFEGIDIIKIIQKHPDIMKQPIVIRGKDVLLIETPTDVLKLTM